MHTPINPSLPRRSVLYIEDNTANIALVEDLIARRGDLNFLYATNGHRGIEMACAHLPVVILMDIQLPDISGFDALKYLRAIPATAHIPVMALSSDAYSRQIEKGIDAGFCQYLTKPFKIGELMDALDMCLTIAAESPRLV
jgi:CheY-like chemotaxis protein